MRRLPITLAFCALGACGEPDIAAETASVADNPAAGAALFFFLTVENRLSEEGTKGRDSDGTQRPNPAPCP